jgi:hypothetical protein
MPDKVSPTAAIDRLKSTLQQIEQQSAGLTPDDTAMVELRRILLGKIAELEAEKLLMEQSTPLPAPAVLESNVLRNGDASSLHPLASELAGELPKDGGTEV